MQEHAGKMHVQSEVGAGTTFRLEFPGAVRSVAADDAAARDAGSAVHV
jgi:signal transduction histidine kinase